MKRKILLIDDIDINRIQLRDILSNEFYVFEATDINEVKDTFNMSSKEVAAIIINMDMKVDIDNIMLMISNNVYLSQIPLFATMEQQDNKMIDKAVSFGVLNVICTPYVPSLLCKLINNGIHIKEMSINSYIYNDSTNSVFYKENEINYNMKEALDEGEFEVWYQPQINYCTGAIVGLEALLRWNHPNKGILIPDDFLYAFEKNGSIYELDKFVWEKVCAFLREMKMKTKFEVPIAVNVSRYDIYHDDIVDYLYGLIQKYDISVKNLRIELTESAFINSNERIFFIVEKLKKLGFIVEIDDFGKGYSSLNSLKDVPADIIKLDMSFLSNGKNADKGGNILASIIRMVKWIGMSVIAEGVENKEQADFLKSVGCYCIQGNLFSHVVTKDEIYKLLADNICDNKMKVIESVMTYDVESLWNPESLDTLIFNSYVGGAAIIEYFKGNARIIRVNDNHSHQFAGKTINNRLVCDMLPEECLDKDNLMNLYNCIKKAVDTHLEASCEVQINNLDGEDDNTLFFRWTTKVISKVEERYLLYCIILNVSDIRIAENRRYKAEKISYENELHLRKETTKNALYYCHVNLTKGIIEEYTSKSESLYRPTKGDEYEKSLKNILHHVLSKKECQDVISKISTSSLMEAYKKGKKTFSFVCRKKIIGKGLRYIEITCSMLEKYNTSEIMAIIYGKDIDMMKKSQLAIKSIMDEEVDIVLMINATNKTAHYIQIKDEIGEFSYEEFEYKCKFESIIKDVINEDKRSFEEFFDFDNLIINIEKNNTAEITYRIKNNDGTIKREMTRAFYLDNTKEDIVMIRRDITRLYIKEQEQKRILQEAVDSANKANNAKSDFLSHVSHDIRTPLNSIILLSSKEIIDGTTILQKEDYIKKIHSLGEYLLEVINDVLDMSKIEQNKIELNPVSYHLSEFEEAIKIVIEHLCNEKNIKFIFNYEPNEALDIIVDKTRLKQIFINLLSNAVKFNRTNGLVEMIIEKTPDKEDKENLVWRRFIVRDNGIGMSKEYLPHAFESFSQEYNANADNTKKGTGLGLAIVKEIVTLMNGTISVNSELEKGTTFVVDLPLLIDKNSTYCKKNNIIINDEILKGKRILICEDNDTNRMVVSLLLKRHGCEVECAENGQVGYELFYKSQEKYYDSILMDIHMPVMNGLETTRKIRQSNRKDSDSIPIIAMTADAFSDSIKEVYDVGMNEHVSKPIIIEEFISILKKNLS